jgi:coenzyme F420-reducing hydrogenase alpha subunit
MLEKPDVGKKAVALRSLGAHILEVVGKREAHIVSTIPGGLTSPSKKSNGKNC